MLCAAELSDADAQSAVDSFGKSDFRRVNNKGAFLMGIIRRVKTEGPDRTHRTSDLDRMHKSVRNRLTDLIDRVCVWDMLHLIASLQVLIVAADTKVCVSLQLILLVCLLQGLLSKEDLHVNMCDALANLPTDLGIEAIETFSRRASSEPVRNKTGFMVRARHPVTVY